MSQIIGKIASVDGEFYAKAPDGSLRELSRGDQIFEGEIIIGADSNSPIDSIIIAMEDGSDVVVLGDESQLFDASLNSKEFSPDETVSEVDSIESILEDYIETEDTDDMETEAGEEVQSADSTANLNTTFLESNNASVDISADVLEHAAGANNSELITNVEARDTSSDSAAEEVQLNTQKYLLISYDKATTRTANQFLEKKTVEGLDLVVDVSQTPSGIMSLFVLPRMREYKHNILLSYSEEYNLLLPYKEDAVTLLTLENRKIIKIEFMMRLEDLTKRFK